MLDALQFPRGRRPPTDSPTTDVGSSSTSRLQQITASTELRTIHGLLLIANSESSMLAPQPLDR